MDKYQEALEHARMYYNNAKEAGDYSSVARYENIFPELRENDDERIRKWLIEMVEELRKVNPTNAEHNGNCSEALAYLERMKESLHIPETCKENADSFTNEDEKIRKEIVDFVNHYRHNTDLTAEQAEWCKKALAWLEKQKDASKAIEAVDRINKYIDKYVANAHDMKDSNPDKKYYCGWDNALGEMARILQDVYSDEKQKEQKPKHFELKAGKWYICHRAFCCRADHLTVKEGERFQCEKDGIVKGFVVKEPEKYFKECSAPAPMEEKQKDQDKCPEYCVRSHCIGCSIYEKQKELPTNEEMLRTLRAEYEKGVADTIAKYEQEEQKFAEWSEEDVINLTNTIRALQSLGMIQKAEHRYDNLIDWLENRFKSLRPQPKQEWSEDYREEDLRTRFAFYTYKDEDVLYLSNVFVEETSRNKGFGTKILAAAEKVAETLGIITICLKVKQDSPANAWYRKHGYGYIAFEDGYDWLEKNLEYLKPSKKEWSEKEKGILLECISALENSGNWLLADKLKSLRPQPTWKPSEEQMKALKEVAYSLVGTGTKTDVYLIQLYEQLKKLK